MRLVRHFLARLVRGGHESESSEFEFGPGPLLGVLAAPGACFSFLLFQKYSSLQDWIMGRRMPNIYSFSAPDKYFFIGLAMGVAGVLTALKWDRILPDSQDYLNLAPLPVPPRTIFLANALAVAFAVTLVAIDVNGVSTFLFPLEVASYAHLDVLQSFRFIAAHAICLTLASLFMFCSILALLGTMAAVLPRTLFRACSPWVRGGVLIGSIVLFVAGNVVPRGADTIGRFYPPLWFLSLYQWLEGHLTPAMAPFLHKALYGLAIVMVWMPAAYALGYRRSFAGVLEGGKPPRKQPTARLALGFLDLFGSGARPFDRACYRFMLRAILRSDSHRMCLAVAAGLGWLLGAQLAMSPDFNSRLEAPFTVAYLLILGLRIAFEMPASVPANWAFRAALDTRVHPGLGAVRRVILSLLVPLVVAPAFVLAWRDIGFGAALIHAFVVLALSMSLAEVMLAGYRKIPLTCPMPPFGSNFLVLIVIQIVAFALFMQLGARLDSWFLEKPWYLPLLPLAMAAAVWWNRRRIAQAREDGELDETLVFENVGPVAITRLDL
ncbi:MAG TPA: hypothetical protein VHW24_03955 [Bryobacteraceae bacterium]|nr:hypothetical protein [Bryobacteraceae bacterium]